MRGSRKRCASSSLPLESISKAVGQSMRHLDLHLLCSRESGGEFTLCGRQVGWLRLSDSFPGKEI